MPMDIDMCLPLDDKTNPLYNQPVSEQVTRLINWSRYVRSARALFSLPERYTQQEVVAAYRQLSKQIHPDKNMEIPTAGEAFVVINLAKEFLDFALLGTSEQSHELQKMVNNPFYKAAQEHPFSDMMFHAGAGHYYTWDYDVSSQEDFNNPALYKEQGFSAILAVLERGRKQVELQESLLDFCPFKLPPAAKERLTALMAQGNTTELINIVDWLNLCRYQDDFDFFQQLCDYVLSQKHQAPLAQIKNFLPHAKYCSDNTTLVDHLFAVIDARTAHFVMSQLSRFIDTNAQDELLHHFKEFEMNTVNQNRPISYHVIAAFLGWHPSSVQLRDEIRADIKKRNRHFDWTVKRDNHNVPDEELYFDKDFFGKDSMAAIRLGSSCRLPASKRKHYSSILISVLREQSVLTDCEALYIASRRKYLDELSRILSDHPKLPLNPYYLLFQLFEIDIFDPSYDSTYELEETVLPGGLESTRDNAIACITRLFRQILAHAQLSPEQLSELFLFLLENNQSTDTPTLNFILARMDECALPDTLQKKIWQHFIKAFTWREDPAFLNSLINRARPLFFDSTPLHHYLFKNSYEPELITRILSAEPRFLSCRYTNMPVMTKFSSYTFLGDGSYDTKYRIGTVNGLYLHHSLTTTCMYGIPSKSKACAVIESMRTEECTQFNEMLEIPIYKNPEQYDMYQWFYNEPPLRYSRCDAMHIAAIRGLDKELLAMLQQGGDYHQKASVWRKSSFFGIETLILEQKSSYQYAKEQHLPESCRWILKQELKDYIQGRQKEDKYITRLSLCGYTLWNGGYNRDDKVYGAKALLHLIESTDFVGFGQDLEVANQFAQEHPALTQGRLGALFDHYKKLCHWFEEEQKTKTGTHYYYWDDKPTKEVYADKRGFNEIESNNNYKPNWN
ncbi:J domain-containing protein [Legionella bononiensis]|uniref:J domain-containing protein n=1 Tax=Legionella bononiensis TaxID=2793102 RepID=UPI001932FE0C|nr:J domain-containing protein [Legionella bononiensis]MBL7561962.1 DnaJ domain-containing protein [Legionella bononiensis]